MNKDVIYIDVEDDITAIIGKVKGAKEKIVALVPPKRIGVLQSAVNLHLLARAANQGGKKLVLISNNSALMALASAAKIPVAKNLQSKPEMAQISALDVDDGEDVIDGASLPVGELARTADRTAPLSDPTVDEVIRENAAETPVRAMPPAPGQLPPKPRAKSGVKVPNFNRFRKKMVFIIGGAVLLLAFLIWAVFFAPRATVQITARTTDSGANAKVTLSDDAETNLDAGTIKSTTKSIEKDASLAFDATGTKDVGEKAKGQVVFENCESMGTVAVPAGTAVTANGLSYVTQDATSVPGGSGGFGGCASPGQSDPVTVVANDIGDSYNTPSGTVFSVSGHSNDSSNVYFRATASSNVDGGSKKQVKVVTASDIQKATDELAQQNNDDVKKQLASQFGSSVMVLDSSFKVDRGDVKSSPAASQEATDGKAKLTGSITFSLVGVDKTEVGRYLDAYFAKQIEGQSDRRVYDNGFDKASFADVTVKKDTSTATLVATAQIGPKIDDQKIKDIAKGKRYGEIQSSLEAIDGVDNVDIKFWPFWVSSAPNDAKRINVEFKLNDAK